MQLRDRNKDLLRKEEQHDRLRVQYEEAKEQMREDANERRQLEEEMRVMKSEIRDYRDRLENTNESVLAREERNREAKKGCAQHRTLPPTCTDPQVAARRSCRFDCKASPRGHCRAQAAREAARDQQAARGEPAV